MTGKLPTQGGIRGGTESTGLGIFYGLKELLNTDSFIAKTQLAKGLKDKTVII